MGEDEEVKDEEMRKREWVGEKEAKWKERREGQVNRRCFSRELGLVSLTSEVRENGNSV